MPEMSARRRIAKIPTIRTREDATFERQRVDTRSLVSNLTPSWFLDYSRYPIQHGNAVEIFCSGEGVMSSIVESIKGAKKSVDIMCTFFDPATPFVRTADGYKEKGRSTSYWRKEDSIGEIIIQALKDNPNLKIRIVAWMHLFGKRFQPSMIGVIGSKSVNELEPLEGSTGFDPRVLTNIKNPEKLTKEEKAELNRILNLRYRHPDAVRYSQQWFHRIFFEVHKKEYGDPLRHELFDRLSFTRRAITTPTHIEDEDTRSWGEVTTLDVGCDHQKSVLIDIEDLNSDDDITNPHGYILGHNYFTEYWSDFPFKHRDPRHEMDVRPYHDFSAKLSGCVLFDLNNNFCEALGAVTNPKDLQTTHGNHSKTPENPPLQRKNFSNYVDYPMEWDQQSLTDEEQQKYRILMGSVNGESVSRGSTPKRTIMTEDEANLNWLYEERINYLSRHFNGGRRMGEASVQVVRTRPDQYLYGSQEKEIKEMYLHVSRKMTNYALIVNQYFQYSKLARQIKAWKAIKNDAFMQLSPDPQAKPDPLYLFMGTCKSERAQMMFRTHQMANEFGVASEEAFPTAFEELYEKDPMADGEHYALNKKGRSEGALSHITLADMDAMHIKPLLFMFYAPPPAFDDRETELDDHAQQVYVHAKLMVADDVFLTLGSANTNTRSFAVDSELNFMTNDPNTAQTTRQHLLEHYVGNIDLEKKEVFPNHQGIPLSPSALEQVHEILQKRMEDNRNIIDKGSNEMNGLIASFNDDRTVTGTRYG